MSKQLKNYLLPILILLISFPTSSARAQSQNTQIEIEGFDISVLDARIADAVAKANAPGASAEAKLVAAAAYLERANLFYNAGRPVLYKFSLGDFRRVLRFQPDNAEATAKRDQIVEIYKQMGRPVPNNGDDADIYNDPNVRYKVKPESISFPEGKPSVTLSGGLQADVAYVYEVAANPGQHVSVSVTSGDGVASLSIYHGSLEEASIIATGNTKWTDTAFEPKNYLVKVSSKSGASYKLTVTVR